MSRGKMEEARLGGGVWRQAAKREGEKTGKVMQRDQVGEAAARHGWMEEKYVSSSRAPSAALIAAVSQRGWLMTTATGREVTGVGPSPAVAL